MANLGQRPVRVGVQFPQFDAGYGELRRGVCAAEEAGVDVVFNWDHFFGPGEASDAAHLECWTTLAAIAEATSRVEVGPLVSCTAYRNADLLADMARTVDHVSGGRLVLGLGAGFKERDFVEYGFDHGTPAGRVSRFESAVERIEFRLGELNPAPLRRIPMLVGGGGNRMLKLVAKHADTFAEGEHFAAKSRALDDWCEKVGRPPAEIERSVLVGGRPQESGDPLHDQGVTLFVLMARGRPAYDLGPLREWLAWRDDKNNKNNTGH